MTGSPPKSLACALILPLCRREQVSVGNVPMMEAAGKGLSGAQSALAVIPIAIANCAEKKGFAFQ